MSISQATKLLWFDRGAAAFERDFPGVIKETFDTDAPMYVCPICEASFRRDAVETGELTAEHVPPESLGGRELVLTCKSCNNNAGSELDAEAHKKEIVALALAGEVEGAIPVDIVVDELRANARLVPRRDGPGLELKIDVKKNNPRTFEALKERSLKKGDQIAVVFRKRRHSELGAKISWFRSGYLALFAAFGYKLALNPAYHIVRSQILKPEKRKIYTFTREMQQRVPFSLRQVFYVPEPKGLAVCFGHYFLIYPGIGDRKFYKRIEAEAKRTGLRPTNTQLVVIGWPSAGSCGDAELAQHLPKF